MDKLDEILDDYWDRIKSDEELITTIQADIKAKLLALSESRAIEAEKKVWDYVSKTPVGQYEIVNLDKDPTGKTIDIEFHYSPPKKYVDSKLKEARHEA